MPTFYSFYQDNIEYLFDDIFVPADLFRDGNLWIWGNGGDGRIGTNDTTNRNTPVTTFAGGTNWKSISGGLQYTAAIKTDGTLWVWGNGANGRLGTNDTTSRNTPVTTFAGGTNWKQVSTGDFHIAAIKTDGTLWIWGVNGQGRLGTNDTTQRNTPVTTFAGETNWKQVSSGGYHTAAIKTDGTLWTWGRGGNGQLGTNDTTNKLTPVTTFAGETNWKQVSGGNIHTVAIKTDGTLWTWGNGTNGRLGNNATTIRSTPVTTFAGGTDWKQVSAGRQHNAAIKTDGTLWVWGAGTNGSLGTDDTTQRNTPVTTFAGGTNWKQVGSANQHTAAIKTDGTLWTWGRGDDGRLGNNDTTDRSTPVTTFSGGTNWKSVIAGYGTVAAIIYDDPVLQ
jgi:alpha-tubulin suppressor-like RCC1 family protein